MLGLSPRGVKMILRPGTNVYDMWDLIGADSYPYASDFKEETRRDGLSRNIGPYAPVNLLSDQSRHILVHPQGAIVDPTYFHRERMEWDLYERCPKQHESHITPPETLQLYAGTEQTCAGMHYECVPGRALKGRLVERDLGEGTYTAARSPDGIEPEFMAAAILAFPINSFDVIRDPEGHTHEDRVQTLLDKLGNGLQGRVQVKDF